MNFSGLSKYEVTLVFFVMFMVTYSSTTLFMWFELQKQDLEVGFFPIKRFENV